MFDVFSGSAVLVINSPWTTTINMYNFEGIFMVQCQCQKNFSLFFHAHYLALLTCWTCLNMMFNVFAKTRPTKHAYNCVDKPCGASMQKVVMIPSDDLGLARHGNLDEVFIHHDFCAIDITFSHKFTMHGVILEFRKLFVLKLFSLEVSKIEWKMIIILAQNCLNCIQLKFAFCELTVILFNPAQTIST